ncbi:MAG: hypothetical protein J6S75_02215 [Thermoguttaceae bacterium]|nr:hypothetical protein [Thermoguttaceae bacterium]
MVFHCTAGIKTLQTGLAMSAAVTTGATPVTARPPHRATTAGTTRTTHRSTAAGTAGSAHRPTAAGTTGTTHTAAHRGTAAAHGTHRTAAAH